MDTLPEIIAVVTFVGVITIIIFEWLDITVAGLLGALTLVFFHVMINGNSISSSCQK